jgi:ferredoxin
MYDPMDMDTVTLTIDGRPVTAEKGKTVLQAAIESGVKIPFYCYHPGLGIDGSCRVCIVKIEKMPKLQTSCSTPVAEGMVVSTQTPDVVEARASVFEFLLINHPLDCPVCDKGGECPLQDYSYSFGPNESRMEFPRRVFDGEGVRADVDFGPTLMLNRNRCILCTRCVRFMREIDTDAQITIADLPGRGRPLAALGKSDGRVPGRRDHDQGLPIQIAPVGQPAGGGHDLYALREGLQHNGMAESQTRVGQGRAADSDDAAVQSGRERLLDVRYRPVRLSLDRRGRTAEPPIRPHRSRSARADRLD